MVHVAARLASGPSAASVGLPVVLPFGAGAWSEAGRAFDDAPPDLSSETLPRAESPSPEVAIFVDPSGFQAAHAPRPAGCDECRWSAPDNKWYRTETRREEAAVGGGLTALRFEIEVKDGARDDKASRAPVAEDRATKAKRVLTGALGHLGRVATGVVLKALPITAPIVVGREVKALAKSVWQDPKAHASDAALAAVAPGAWVTVHTHGMAMAGKAAADRGDLEGVGEQVAAAGVFVGSLVVVPLLGPEAAEAGATPVADGRLQVMAQEIRLSAKWPPARNQRTIAVGEDAAGRLYVGSSNGLDAGQRAAAARLGIVAVRAVKGAHAEEELLRWVVDLTRVGTDRRAPCGPGEHNCAGQLSARGVQVDNK